MSVLPTSSENVNLPMDFYFVREPSFTYKYTEDSVAGYVNNLEAYKQAVYKILNTERYDYIIYSWDYGVELKDLIGKHIAYAVPEIERRVTEAIMQDDRTVSVSEFEFDTSKFGVVAVTFKCTSIYGDVEINTNVEI